MPRLDWHDKLNINVAKIDEQHRQLLKMAQLVHDALHADSQPDVLLDKLDRLLEYTREHFVFEETLMVEHSYPGLEDHRQEHVALLHRVELLREALANGKALSYSADIDVADDWVLAHVNEEDKQLGLFLNERQVF